MEIEHRRGLTATAFLVGIVIVWWMALALDNESRHVVATTITAVITSGLIMYGLGRIHG